MINIKDINAVANEAMKNLVIDLRKVHVSRFPIDMVVSENGMCIKFMDSRFPNDHWRYKDNNKEASVAFLWLDDTNDGKPVYKIYSRLIQNNRYASYNDDYHTRATADLRKMAKYLKDVVVPFSAQEIALRTYKEAGNLFESWQSEAAQEIRRSIIDLKNSDWLDIFEKLKELDVKPVNDKHADIYNNALPAYHEAKKRRKITPERIHVFVNPDGTVQTTNVREKHTASYDSMEALPTDLRQQVAMLQLTLPGNYLGNVGVKVAENSYWIDVL